MTPRQRFWNGMLAVVVLAALLLACDPRIPEPAAPSAPDTTIAVTAPWPSVWYVKLDTTWLQIYAFHIAPGVYADTVHLPVPDTLPHVVYGVRLNPASGNAMCHDWHVARRADVVTLVCGPVPAIGTWQGLLPRRVLRRTRLP